MAITRTTEPRSRYLNTGFKLMTSARTGRQVLRDLYEVDAKLTPLYGELDDNFLAETTSGEKRILKIMHAGCNLQRVDLQCEAMRHLAPTAIGLNLPLAIPTTAGQACIEIDVDGIRRLVWSLRYCPGTLLKHVTPLSNGLMRSFGRMMALIDLGLESFTHPAMKQRHKWELTRAGRALPFVQYVEGDAASRIDAVLRHFENNTLEKLKDLPHSVIHNDANEGNVLVNVTDGGDTVVDGLIDFGDMSYQPTVCEVAIALAYVVTDADDPLAGCAGFLESYSELKGINDDEIAVLYDLILTRLAVIVAIAAERRHADPDDQLGNQDRRRTVRAISRLADISPKEAENAFRQACAKSANSIGEGVL